MFGNTFKPFRIIGNTITNPFVLNMKHFCQVKSFQPKIDLLYDSRCPLCDMEIKFLRKHDTKRSIQFTDISSLDYNPMEHGNVTYEDGMKRLHAILPDHTTVSGVEVVRRVYAEVGLGWFFAITKLPIIGQIADRVYDIWAENRLRMTGRPELADLLRDRAKELQQLKNIKCTTDACSNLNH